MSNPGKSVFVFGLYLVGLGVILTLAPNILFAAEDLLGAIWTGLALRSPASAA